MNKEQIEQKSKYYFTGIENDRFLVLHEESGELLATTDSAEKAHFITASANTFNLETFEAYQNAGKESEGEAAKCIQDIENLFPADCQYPDTAAIGKELLLLAMESAGFNWRKLPAEVLQQYRMLCIWKENDQIREAGVKRLQ